MMALALTLFFVLLLAVVTTYVAIDARRHGQSGVAWALITVVTFPLGALAWLVIRAVRTA